MDGQEGFFKMEANLAPKESAAPKGHRRYTPRLNEDVAYDEVVSGLQKMIRRGKEREALILAQEMFDNNYFAAVARRLMIIAVEDIGLANPTLVQLVYTLCMGYLAAKKESNSGWVEPLALYMAILMMCRSAKNRECDDAQIVTLYRMKKGLDSAKKVIEEDEAVIVDKHTERGKVRLRKLAATNGTTYEQEAMKEFLTVGTVLAPGVEIGGNKWGREAREIYGCTK